MYIEKNTRRFQVFDITDDDERRDYEALLADPGVRIVSRSIINKTDTTTESVEGQSTSNSSSRPLVCLEYEELTL
jgi:hypothetical protein